MSTLNERSKYTIEWQILVPGSTHPWVLPEVRPPGPAHSETKTNLWGRFTALNPSGSQDTSLLLSTFLMRSHLWLLPICLVVKEATSQDCNDVSTSRGGPRTAGNHQKLETGLEQILPVSWRNQPASTLILDFWPELWENTFLPT